jgi:hypothetical protein
MQFLLLIGLILGSLTLQSASAVEYNVLTAAEKAQGWQLMFDGKSLTGWHSYGKTNISTGKWAIADSAIYRKEQGANAILAPNQFAFQDFELSIDYKIPDIGNSGIFLRYLEVDPSEFIRTGPEAQICGKLHADYSDGVGIHSPGACYDMFAPRKAWIKSADEYNTFRIVVFNKRVAHYGNGIKLLEYEIDSPEWKTQYQLSKYSFFPQYGEVHKGKVMLQDHVSPVWFRNIKIRPLTTDPWTDTAFQWPDKPVSNIHSRKLGLKANRTKFATSESGAFILNLSSDLGWKLKLSDVEGRTLQQYPPESR